MRHFLRSLFFFVLALPLAHRAVRGQEIVSTWWYPLGNPQGTLHNPAPTKSQRESDLAIKWRAPQLKNSPTTLVGGIRTVAPGRQQQIVGTQADSVIILSALGLLERKVAYRDQGLTNDFTLTLTGLFNLASATQSVNARGLPNRIGIGVERRQRNTPGDPTPLSLVAFLADSLAVPREEIKIDPLPNIPDLNNQSAGIYPVAAYSSSVLVAVSQNSYAFTGAGGAVVNSIRKYDITGRNPTLRWSYPVAPRTYAQHPALLADPAQTTIQRIALSTSSYPHSVHITARPQTTAPVSGRETTTDSMYSVQVLDNSGVNPVHVNTFRIPLSPPFTTYQGEAHSYFIALSESANAENFQLITENHSPAKPGPARMWLTSATPNATNRDKVYASFTADLLPRNDLGLAVVTANIDGGAPDRTIVDGGFSYYVNNPDDELVVAYKDLAGADLATNYLYVLRRRQADAIGDSIPFDAFIRYAFSGRLMAGGDLITGDVAREELVTAHGNTVNILQLRGYDDDAFNRRGDPVRDFFRVARSFTLDADVVSVAIADLEGDDENDLVVTTKTSTYAIGLKTQSPFGVISPEKTSYCPGNEVKVRWNRNTGGGQDGVRLVLMRGADSVRVIGYRHISAGVDLLNPGTGPDSITFSTTGLAPGTYRLRVEDTVVASLRDLSQPFVIEQPAITNFSADAGAAPQFNDPVSIAAHITCADSVHLLRSYDEGAWEKIGEYPTIQGDSAAAQAVLLCPAAAECGSAGSVAVRFKFLDPASGAESETISIEVPIITRTVDLDDPASQARRRTIHWNPADYGCSDLTVALIPRQGPPAVLATGIQASLGEFTFEVPDLLGDTLMVRLCCTAGSGASCAYGLSGVFSVPELPTGNYVAPNPFNPAASNPAGGAVIVFRLAQPATVSVTIYDASRAVVARLRDGVPLNEGRQKILWNGRNSLGDIVGAGTYICIIERGSEQPIVLPVIVAKH